jgi:hypothetical protein
MPRIPLDRVIAERKLLLDGDSVVTVRIAAPEHEDEQTCICRYEISGVAHAGPGYARGVDTAQALVLALNMIAVVLATSREAKAGRLEWLGDKADFGFPFLVDIARPSNG